MSDLQPGDLVAITWVDSKNYEGWQHYHGADVSYCRSVGWVLENDEVRTRADVASEHVVLAQTRSDDGNETMVNGVIAIPWACITYTESLSKAA